MINSLKPEELIQATCVALLRERGVLAFHPANEGRHTPRYRAKQKLLGLEKGVSDLVILQRPPAMQVKSGAVLELKAKGKPTIEQFAFLNRAKQNGYVAAWALGLVPAVAQLVYWGYLPATDLERVAPLCSR